MGVDINDLQELTSQFFLMHWNQKLLHREPPEWSAPYLFVGGNCPNYDKQGVYAFLKGRNITYIGVAAALGGGRYTGHGIGKRFQSYTHVVDGKHTAKDVRLVESGAIITIGFEPEHAYMALALESYLLGRMPTIHNVNRQGRPRVSRVL